MFFIILTCAITFLISGTMLLITSESIILASTLLVGSLGMVGLLWVKYGASLQTAPAGATSTSNISIPELKQFTNPSQTHSKQHQQQQNKKKKSKWDCDCFDCDCDCPDCGS
ncbi:hypothetical protein [Risungbinella massiliensis]|uniref:hypothetical protein n=1 Tax=Risungbinella massiliensis TaxID=1329796 RepID=UPI0005CC0CFC|nr:hypothetical protein [Risungbinella massiliensis]